MNYLQEIKSFNDWLILNPTVTSDDICLWYALMNLNNMCGWQKEFTVAISTIVDRTRLSRSAIYRSRNKLVQLGRIKTKERPGNQASIYELIPVVVFQYGTQSETQPGTQSGTQRGTQSGTQRGTQSGTINKTKLEKTKLSKSHSGGDPPAEVEKEETTAFWKPMVDIWFKFYKQHYQINPTFKKEQGENLKRILAGLQKIASTASEEWTEDAAGKYFKKFLFKAHRDDWLKNNFLLKNLNSNFDSIATPVNDGTTSIRSTNSQTSRADCVGAGQDTTAAILREQLSELEP